MLLYCRSRSVTLKLRSVGLSTSQNNGPLSMVFSTNLGPSFKRRFRKATGTSKVGESESETGVLLDTVKKETNILGVKNIPNKIEVKNVLGERDEKNVPPAVRNTWEGFVPEEEVKGPRVVRKWGPKVVVPVVEEIPKAEKRVTFLRHQQFSPIETRKMKFNSELFVNKFIKDNLDNCSKSNIADLMSISVKVSKDNKRITYLKIHLPAIAIKLEILSDSIWKFRDLSAVVFGLQYFNDHDEGVIDIIKVMTSGLQLIINNSEEKIKESDLSKLILGLQRINNEKQEIKEFLSVLAQTINQCTQRFTNTNIGNAFYGLLKMSSHDPNVRTVIQALSKKLKVVKGDLGPQDFGNIFFPFRGMNSEYQEVRHLLRMFAGYYKGCTTEMKGSQLLNLLSCLQSMSSDDEEVRELLSCVNNKLSANKDIFLSKPLGSAINGLQNCNSDRREVRTLLSLLAGKTKKNIDIWNPESLSSAFLGLQRMGNCTEVQEMLFSLVPKIRNLKVEMTGGSVGDCLYGLQGMSTDIVEIKDVLYALNLEIRKSGDAFIPRALSYAIFGLQGMKSDSVEFVNIFNALCLKFKGCVGDFHIGDVDYGIYGLQGLRRKSMNNNNTNNNDNSDNTSIGNNAGNSSINDNVDFDYILNVYYENTMRIINSNLLSVTTRELISFYQSLLFFQQEMKGYIEIETYNKWDNIKNIVLNELKNREEKHQIRNNINNGNELEYENDNKIEHMAENNNYNDVLIGQSVTDEEKKLFESCSELFNENENVEIIQKEILLNAFESDIVVRIRKNRNSVVGANIDSIDVNSIKNDNDNTGNITDISIDSNMNSNMNSNTDNDDIDSYITINIEIDILNNKKEKKKIFRIKRDKIVKSQGISVIRIHALILEGMTIEDTKVWVQKKINEIYKF